METMIRGYMEQLQKKGYKALAYHAGMDTATRALHQRRFLREDGIIMAAAEIRRNSPWRKAKMATDKEACCCPVPEAQRHNAAVCCL